MNTQKATRSQLHPGTIKYLKKGHPWVTLDRFSSKFSQDHLFLIGLDNKGKEVGLFLNDPNHKNIKARLWSTRPPYPERIHHFPRELKEKIHQSLNKRKNAGIFDERDNVYLVFGEGDFLPGLFIIAYGQHILIQYYAYYWRRLEKKIIQILKDELQEFLPTEKRLFFWSQKRFNSQKNQVQSLQRSAPEDFEISEFGINYKIKMTEGYDKGLYTDMSSIRKKIQPHLSEARSVLNLYAYTGAFSLFALKNGADYVCSVDLSAKYIEWLEQNIDLNQDLSKEKHESLIMPVDKALDKLLHEQKKFDFIICDPPSASSDGKKVSQALKSYDKTLPKLFELTTDKANILILLNTHTISISKFEKKVQEIIKEHKKSRKIVISKHFKLAEDCPTITGFQEGNYLKGFLLTVS